MTYYGFIEDIWEVDYTKFSVLVFKCKWVVNKSGVKIDESGFTLVDFRKMEFGMGHLYWFNKHLKFSMSKILRQNIGMLFYMRKKEEEAIDDVENCDLGSFTQILCILLINKDDDLVDNVHATCKDHSEGIYI